jgi:hypothetical protein
VESDPNKLGDQGNLAEYCATEANGISVNPLEDSVPNVVRPKPGAALNESQGVGRNWSKMLNVCSFRPPLKAIAPAVTPPENWGEAIGVSDREVSAGLRWDCASAALASHKRTCIARMTETL